MMGKSVKRKGKWVVEEHEDLIFLNDLGWKARLVDVLPKIEESLVRLAKIASEDPNATIIEDSDYDENPHYSLTYHRSETTEERIAREERQAKNAKRSEKARQAAKLRAEARAKLKEAEERKMLASLLKKYGGTF